MEIRTWTFGAIIQPNMCMCLCVHVYQIILAAAQKFIIYVLYSFFFFFLPLSYSLFYRLINEHRFLVILERTATRKSYGQLRNEYGQLAILYRMQQFYKFLFLELINVDAYNTPTFIYKSKNTSKQ